MHYSFFIRTFTLASLCLFSLSLCAQQIAPYRKGNKWGYYDLEKEKMVVDPVYDSVNVIPPFSPMYVYKDKKAGCIKGERELFSCRFELLKNSGDSLFLVQEDGKYYVAASETAMAHCSAYDSIDYFSESIRQKLTYYPILKKKDERKDAILVGDRFITTDLSIRSINKWGVTLHEVFAAVKKDTTQHLPHHTEIAAKISGPSDLHYVLGIDTTGQYFALTKTLDFLPVHLDSPTADNRPVDRKNFYEEAPVSPSVKDHYMIAAEGKKISSLLCRKLSFQPEKPHEIISNIAYQAIDSLYYLISSTQKTRIGIAEYRLQRYKIIIPLDYQSLRRCKSGQYELFIGENSKGSSYDILDLKGKKIIAGAYNPVIYDKYILFNGSASSREYATLILTENKDGLKRIPVKYPSDGAKFRHTLYSERLLFVHTPGIGDYFIDVETGKSLYERE